MVGTMTTQRSRCRAARRSLELLWRAASPAPGPKPSLTLERIVEAAIAVADADGIDGALHAPGRRRAGRGHDVALPVRSRQVRTGDPHARQGQRAHRRIHQSAARTGVRGWRPRPATPTGSTSATRGCCGSTGSGRCFGPNTLAITEFVVASLDGLGLSDQERMSAINSLDAFVAGMARQRVDYEAATEATGVSEEEFWWTAISRPGAGDVHNDSRDWQRSARMRSASGGKRPSSTGWRG